MGQNAVKVRIFSQTFRLRHPEINVISKMLIITSRISQQLATEYSLSRDAYCSSVSLPRERR